ncbi:hydrophobic surface binding protein A-domain-containing protein [Leptodontidium sp. 2 PMI_412]|nr:hydrophobic surface binding protein A-domain-containing protein [Leptodontidium sp. 2 PMI_412]
MVSFKSLLLLGATALAATVPQVITDITNLDNNVKSLISSTSAYNGGFISASPQLFALIPVYTSLLKGVTDTGLLPSSLTVSEAYEIINHVNATLAIDNPIAVDTLIGKRELYAKAGLSDAIVAALGLLKLGHEAFTKNVVERVPESTLADGTAVALVISNALQKGIDYFEAS